MNVTDEKIRNLLSRRCGENSSSILHKFIKIQTKEFEDLNVLKTIIEQIFNISIFAGCREYIKIESICNNGRRPQLFEKLDSDIKDIVKNILKIRIEDMVRIESEETYSEIIIAFYIVKDYLGCSEFLKENNFESRYFYKLFEQCEADEILSQYIYDIIIFIMDSTKDEEDKKSSAYIRSVNLINPKKAEMLMKNKKEEICKLAKWYFEHEQYMSLSALMRMFEILVCDDGFYRQKVYEYIGIEKSIFCDKVFSNGSARALELYFLVKYYHKFPILDEIRYILELGTSSSVFCIVHQCFRKIKADGYIDENVKEILGWIIEKIKSKHLKFDYIDEAIDPGISNQLLRINITDIFHILCKNKEDVLEFLNIISKFNVFSNVQLRLDYNIVMNNKKKYNYTLYEQEYDYICNRYTNKNDVASVVMNSYLRFFVDVEELYKRCGEKLREFWFPAYETNDGEVKLFNEILNPNFREKNYTIHRSSMIKRPEEIRKLRIKIKNINEMEKKVYLAEREIVSKELSDDIYCKVKNLLRNGEIFKAYQYLVNHDNPEYNLHRRDKYIAIREFASAEQKKFGMELENLFIENRLECSDYIRYIYINSKIRTFVSFDKMKSFFDYSEYLLGDILLPDNRNFKEDAFYYIVPNYYNPSRLLYRISKKSISEELNYFIEHQLMRIAKLESYGVSIQKENIRVCFYMKKDDENDTIEKEELCKINLHCCDKEINSLTVLMETYYNMVDKMKRSGIANNVLKNYMFAYGQCAITNGFGAEWFDFAHMYLEYLYNAVDEIYRSKCRKKLFNNDEKLINLFYVIQFNLIKNLVFDDDFKSFIKNDKKFKSIIETLKSCYEQCNETKSDRAKYKFLINTIYKYTLLGNVFDSVAELNKNIIEINS